MVWIILGSTSPLVVSLQRREDRVMTGMGGGFLFPPSLSSGRQMPLPTRRRGGEVESGRSRVGSKCWEPGHGEEGLL